MTAAIFYIDAPNQSASFVVCDSFDGETMTAAHDQRYDETIFRQACLHFKCEERTLGRYDIGASKRDPGRTKRRKRLKETIDRFNALMTGPNPPKTKQQAVKALSPFLAFLLSAFIRSVIEWLWDQTQKPVTVTTSGATEQ